MNSNENRNQSTVHTWSPSLVRCVGASTFGILVGGVIIHLISPVFARELYEPLGLFPTPDQIAKYKSSLIKFWTWNDGLDFAVIGAALGTSLGLLTTQTNRTASACLGGAVGLLLGTMSGILASRWAVQAYITNADQSLIRSIGVNTIVWGSLQCGTTVAIGLAQGQRKLAILGTVAILAGIAASAVFLIVFSVLFPASDLSYLVRQPLPEKVVWLTSISIVLGCGLFFALKKSVK